MLQSMTGYASKTIEIPGKDDQPLFLSIEIKSFNTRFFEGTVRLPSSFSMFEHKILSRLKRELTRGRVYFTARAIGETTAFECAIPVLKIAQDYIKGFRRIQETCDVKGDMSLSDIVRMPNVFSFERNQLTKAQADTFFDSVLEVIDELKASRMREGKDLEEEINVQLAASIKKIGIIDTAYKKLVGQKKREVAEVRTMAEQGDIRSKALLEDHYKLLDKLDVHEEVTRFNSHVSAIRLAIESKDAEKGRRLDFIMQEVMREVNTITSKCANFGITAAAVDIKVEVEKIREQVQNVV